MAQPSEWLGEAPSLSSFSEGIPTISPNISISTITEVEEEPVQGQDWQSQMASRFAGEVLCFHHFLKPFSLCF